MIEETVIKQFEKIAKEYPNKIAVITEFETITYEELNKRANQLANYMQKSKWKYDCAIGVCLAPSINMLVSVLAVQKLGITYVPIDKTYPDKRINYMIHDACISCILADRDFANRSEVTDTNIIYLDSVNYYKCGDDNISTKYNEIIYILYTSGSTGEPKGVEVCQKGITNYLNYSCDNYIKKDEDNNNPASFVYLPLAFDASVTSLYTPLMVGRSLVIPTKQGIEVFNDLLVKENRFDFVKMTPAHLFVLKEQISPMILEKWTRYLVVGGETLTFQHLSYFKDLGLNWTIVNEYGPTETVVGSTTYFFSLKTQDSKKIPIGKPIYNTDIYIVNKKNEIVPIGEVGEIVIGGLGVTKGYCNKPQLTKERFIEDFISCGNRVYKTGDLGMYTYDGDLVYCGRIDEQVKIRGYRIELSDIESGLKKIPGILDAAVIV